MRVVTVGLAILLLAAFSPVHAAERLYCAAADEVLRLSIESDISASDKGKLVNFRGVVGIKDEKVPPAFRHLRFDTPVLAQQSMNDQELRLQLSSDLQDKQLVGSFELTIFVTSTRKNERFQGDYDIRISTSTDNKTPRDIVLSHGASVVCDLH
ncbi:hypothetical protein G6N76_08505 [Rhizobium daejeonense]|uniref:Uncharacterized protein n=1 Tax=Rhizobium daejeonense TaxID=240521 RepID=A0A6M1SAF0_9HYPH|nr:hypothetical protein [Rhizobium daejeonense]NGO63716.1 hypothetical protein [Rhizobium daejeonense]